MGIFDLFRGADIHQGIEEYESAGSAVLLDVRTVQEYRDGHIPGARNVPLDALSSVSRVARNKEEPLFVYCYSGARSRQAAGLLQRMGYTNVKNIGGIAGYRGKVEK